MPGVYLTVFKRLSGGTFGTFMFQSFESFETVFALQVALRIPEPIIRLYDAEVLIN